MKLGRTFPGVDADFWTMHNVILKSSIYSLCIQGFQIKYKIIICIASYFKDNVHNYLELRKQYLTNYQNRRQILKTK
jgi:hypothetical protein